MNGLKKNLVLWSCLFLITPLWSFAQVVITGTVLNMADTKPIAAASVFLNNTTIGSETEADGSFRLVGVKPGRYQLGVSILGYEPYQQAIEVGSSELHLAPISLVSKSIMLNSVRIRPDERWYRLYKDFKAEFLGAGPYAAKCKILNPEILDLDYDARTRELTAVSTGYLVIENKALGYKIKYSLQRFVKDYGKQSLIYTGFTIFSEMDGNAAEKQQWQKNRLDCYNGSEMHFLRAVVHDKVTADDFEAYKLIKKIDSSSYWKAKHHTDFKYIFPDSLFSREDYYQTTNHPDIFAIIRPCIYVIYKDKLDYGLAPIYKQVNMPNWQTTIITLTGNYALFDRNGVLVDPTSVSVDGYWALNRVGDQLPVDYEPPAAKK